MEPRLSLVTLGVADVSRARAFYERLGFKASSASNENVIFFEAGALCSVCSAGPRWRRTPMSPK